MELDVEYEYLFNHTNNLNKILELSSTMFGEDEYRQNNYSVHKDTKSVILAFNFNKKDGDVYKFPRYNEFFHLLKPLMVKLKHEFKFKYFKFDRLIIAKLPAGKSIAHHEDNKAIFGNSNRVHWCLQTNSKVDFIIGGKIIPFETSNE